MFSLVDSEIYLEMEDNKSNAVADKLKHFSFKLSFIKLLQFNNQFFNSKQYKEEE